MNTARVVKVQRGLRVVRLARLLGAVVTLGAMHVATPAAFAQHAGKRTTVTLILKHDESSVYSAAIRRDASAPVTNVISFKRSEFTPGLLALTLMSLNGSVERDGQSPTAKKTTYFRSGAPVPGVPTEWDKDIARIAARLMAAGNSREGASRLTTITEVLPVKLLCTKCDAKESAKTKPSAN